MSKTTKIIIGIVVVLLIIFAISKARHASAPSTQGSEITIGAILPLSGDVADIGAEVSRGAQIAVDDLAKQGVEVNYLAEDDAWDPKKAVSAAQKLTAIDHANAVFTLAGSEAKPMVTVFDKAQAPLLVAWDSSLQLKQSSPYIFSIGFSNEATGEKLATFFHDELGLKNVAVVSHVDEVGDIMVASFVKKFTDLGGTIASKDRVPVTTTDFRPYITKIKNEKADGVATFFNPPAHSIMAKQKQELSLNVPIGGPDITDSDIEAGGSAIDGEYETYIWTDKVSDLAAKYKAKFGSDPYSALYAAFGYDSVLALGMAAHNAETQHVSVAEALRNLKTNETTTPIDMHGTNFSERIEKVFQIKNGERVLIEKQ